MWLHTNTVYELQMGTADRPVLLRLWSCQAVTPGELLIVTKHYIVY